MCKTKPMRHVAVPPVSGIADRGGRIGGDFGKALRGWRRFLENSCDKRLIGQAPTNGRGLRRRPAQAGAANPLPGRNSWQCSAVRTAVSRSTKRVRKAWFPPMGLRVGTLKLENPVRALPVCHYNQRNCARKFSPLEPAVCAGQCPHGGPRLGQGGTRQSAPRATAHRRGAEGLRRSYSLREDPIPYSSQFH